MRRLAARLRTLFSGHSMAERAERRVRRLPRVELLDWADTAGTGVAQALHNYRRAPSTQSLKDAADGAMTLGVILAELVERENA